MLINTYIDNSFLISKTHTHTQPYLLLFFPLLAEMEMPTTPVAVAVAFAVTALAIWAWKALDWVWLKPKRLEAYLKRQGITGNPYTFLVGDVRKELGMVKEASSRPIGLNEDFAPRVAPLLMETVKNHGKLSYMWIGPTPTVIIMKPDHIKEVFNKVYDFPKPPSHPMVKLLASGVATYDGEKWSKHRKIINPAFHLEKLKKMVPALYENCGEVISKWERLILEGGSSVEVDVWQVLVSMTADVISRTAFGSSYEEGKQIFELQEEQAKRVLQALQMGFIPGFRFLPTKNNKRMKEIDREVKWRLREIINKREMVMKTGEAPEDDLLGILLESNSGEGGMSIEDVIEECRLFYLAGQETTSVLLVWTMILLSQHQEWQARARDEVLQVFGQEKPDFDGLSHLKTVTMILNEVFRLYPPVVLLGRSTDKETRLGDKTLPSGVQIAVPMLLVHHDPDLWGEDVLKFKPERFADGISKATKNQLSFLPFGWGPRICPGQNFAMTEAKMALSLILQRFSFELSPSYKHSPHMVLTLHPQFGAQLIFRKL
ncbi:PREDICTED: cytochrome P450 72A15-like [Tarenaya hassleriana]|uniref:cytochrome P450 72A15-like n=1 Tax=Tarenaya hassleriana TaxID=28532 RepID=UPI00053C4895|nr:PREDICTED: cytochrome P450 72A15-like [Tarenaya hassleriana]